MDLNALIMTIATFITILGYIEHKIKIIRRNKFIRKAWWWLKNEKIKVKVQVVRKYPQFDYDVKILLSEIKKMVGKFTVPPTVGENYIIFSTEIMTAPIKLTFHLGVDDEDSIGEYIEVSAIVLGELVFVYRESKNYSKIVDLLDRIYDRIEQIYNVKPIFSSNVILATISDFKEDWSVKKEITGNDTKIQAGSNVVMVSSSRLQPLADVTEFLTLLG